MASTAQPPPKRPRHDVVRAAARVGLNPADCNLDFVVGAGGLRGHALHGGGFAYCWSGARATAGVRGGGRYCFGCKVVSEQPVEMEDTEADQRHLCRVGVSRGDDPLGGLGESGGHSFGFGGTGKLSHRGNFFDYGVKFAVGDTIVCAVDLDSKPMAASIGFSRNGAWLGVAQNFDASETGVDAPVRPWESAIFPHVLLKNVVVEMLFSREDGLEPVEGYEPWSSACADGNAVFGPVFAEQGECEVMMMVGLPASGKSTWAEKWVKEHPEKRYVLLGTNLALDQMKVPGLLCKNKYAERFDRLMEHATMIFNTLLDRAAKIPHNYIMDQTNVYKSARIRKLRPFANYRKIAVVVFPLPSELNSRASKWFKEMGKDVPAAEAVDQMTANFILPQSKDMPGSKEPFDEVIFVELSRDDAQRNLDEMKHLLPRAPTASYANISNQNASGARMKRPDRGDVIAATSRNIEETQATKKMLKKRRLEGSSSAGFSHPSRDHVKKLRRGKPDDVACWASPPTDGRQMTSGCVDGRRMWSGAVMPPPHAHPRTPFYGAAAPKDKPGWLSSGPHKSDMSHQPKEMKELGVNRSSTCRTNQVSKGVNRSSTLRRIPTNRLNAGLGLSGSLPCVPEEGSRSGAGLFSTPLAITEIGEKIEENLVKYCDKELANVLSKWVNIGSLEDYVFNVDIYEATLPSLKKHFVDGMACFVLNLHEMKTNAKGKKQYKRTTPDGRWLGVGFNPYDGGEFIRKKFTRTCQGCNLVMYEYSLKGGPRNKVLCKLHWKSPERKEEETPKTQKVLEGNYSTLKDKYSKLKDQCTVLKDNYRRSENDRSTLQKQMKDLQEYVSKLESSNKLLNNQILELKGNVRVFCRVRPFRSNTDSNHHEEATISYPSSFENVRRGIVVMNKGQKEQFLYDKVFDHRASQDDVFVEISDLVQSALDGYKVCIFAYGSTGSGKTYTMIGNPGHDQKGIIPRSLEQIFKSSQSLELGGWKYALQASMLEMYNETIRDLLAPGCSKQYKIVHDSQGNTTVSNLTVINVLSTGEVMSLLDKASHYRSVCKTQLNDKSSRSHFVFTLKIFGSNESTGQQVQGVLNFVDLAGTERLKDSGATGNCAKETAAINRSLLVLSQVITQIANKKENHVSFRDSKLTHLLQTCLDGQSKVLMFVNIAPEASRAGETLCSLRFAKNVNRCELGVARRQATDNMTHDSELWVMT